jgi:hypothetical protein
MSIIEKLTEGIVNRDLKQEGQALLNKWSQTGLLEGLQTDQTRQNMARLLENQAKELLRESSSMGAGHVEGFAAVAFPIVRRVFAGLIANDLVSVQPMSLPSGLIFFLDFVYSDNLGDGQTQTDRGGNTVDRSIYGTDRVGSEITGGVNIVGTNLKENQSGPRQLVGYSYSNATSSLTNAESANVAVKAVFALSGNVSETNGKFIQFDPDLMSKTDGDGVVVFDIKKTGLTSSLGDLDLKNLGGISIDDTSLNTAFTAIIGNTAKIARRLTQEVAAADAATSADSIRFVAVADAAASYNASTSTAQADPAALAIEFPLRDSISAAGSSGADAVGSIAGFNFPLEDEEDIPEIDIKVDSIAITAQSKKLKAKWTPELGQDLNAYHNLDAEVELTSILSEQIALEIDREILADLVNGATAATYYWSRSPGLFVNRENGQELGATAAAPDFTGTVSEWYETLIETINDVSAQIHRKTLRGGANYVVVSPEVANILEFTAGFRANVTADADKGDIGAVKVGALSRKFDVIVDPYFPRQVVLVGRKGTSFLESGYVYAPYVPLQTTPTIFGPEDFVPRKGVMTRYAKKMVRPDMYGIVIIRGLTGEGGAS